MQTNSNSWNFSMPNIMLRVEGLAVLTSTLILYSYREYSWLTFAILLLAPDLPMIVYVFNQKAGTIIYNLVHTYSFPLGLLVLSLLTDSAVGVQLTLIWLAHIGMDRMVGYGLK